MSCWYSGSNKDNQTSTPFDSNTPSNFSDVDGSTSTPIPSALVDKIIITISGQSCDCSEKSYVHTFDLFHRSHKPFPGADNPETHAVEYDDSHSHDGVVERLWIDGLHRQDG